MKKAIILLAAAFLTQTAAFAQTWKLDKAHANLKFTATHMLLSDVDGRFKDFDASITSSKADFSDAKFDFTAQVKSIDTDNEKRDTHLKSPDFFDAEKFETISFKSTKIAKAAEGKYKVTGNLTIHGVTKPVTLDVWFRGAKPNPMTKGQSAGFQVTGTIDRTDFGVGASVPDAVVSKEITFKANGEFGNV